MLPGLKVLKMQVLLRLEILEDIFTIGVGHPHAKFQESSMCVTAISVDVGDCKSGKFLIEGQAGSRHRT